MLKKPFKNNLLLNQYQGLVNQINNLENDLKLLTDSELRDKSFKLQKQYAAEQNLNTLISQAFALTREASIRTLGLRHFDVQLPGSATFSMNSSGNISLFPQYSFNFFLLPSSFNFLTYFTLKNYGNGISKSKSFD